MLPHSLIGSLRFWLPTGLILGLMLGAAVLAPWCSSSRPPTLEAEELLANPTIHLGSQVVVTGKWLWTNATEEGYMIVMLRSKNRKSLVCHFEELRTADEGWLQSRLLEFLESVNIRGRCGIENDRVVLRECRVEG